MNPIDLILSGARPPGIYRLDTNLNADHLVEPLTHYGWRAFYLNGRVMQNKADFLRVASAAMDFPAYFGYNWDSFEECIRDLAWAPSQGYVLIYDRVWQLALPEHKTWQVVRSILTDAVDYWRTTGIPFYVLLCDTWWYARDIEQLTGKG